MCAALQLGYRQKSEHWDMQYDFANELDYPLPKGFHFVNRQDMDMEKVSNAVLKGLTMNRAKAHGTISMTKIITPFSELCTQ